MFLNELVSDYRRGRNVYSTTYYTTEIHLTGIVYDVDDDLDTVEVRVNTESWVLLIPGDGLIHQGTYWEIDKMLTVPLDTNTISVRATDNAQNVTEEILTVFIESDEVLTPPSLFIEIVNANVVITWEEVHGANSYIIYSSDNPYTENWEQIAVVGVPGYTELISEELKFYRVVASSDELPLMRMSYPDNIDQGE